LNGDRQSLGGILKTEQARLASFVRMSMLQERHRGRDALCGFVRLERVDHLAALVLVGRGAAEGDSMSTA
jgi:hypothetical protein